MDRINEERIRKPRKLVVRLEANEMKYILNRLGNAWEYNHYAKHASTLYGIELMYDGGKFGNVFYGIWLHKQDAKRGKGSQG